MAIRRRKKPSLVLPLTSMGDIAFLLIIFFMLASNFMKTGNVELDRARAGGLEKQEAAKSSVMMDKDGAIWYEGQKVNASEVTEAIRALTENNRDLSVHVTIDRGLLKKDFMPLIEAICESGAKMVLIGDSEE